MSHTYAGTSYTTRTAMLDAMAHAFAVDDGYASYAEITETLAQPAEALAAEMICQYGLDQPLEHVGDGNENHMQVNGYDADELAAAFTRLSARLADGSLVHEWQECGDYLNLQRVADAAAAYTPGPRDPASLGRKP